MEAFLKTIFILAFLLIYVLAVILLKPFRIHEKRKVSTITIKVSFLIYFAVLLTYVFFIIFFKKEIDDDISAQYHDMKTILVYIATLLAVFIPNAAILLRRKFKRKRIQYNYVFTVINMLIVLFFAALFHYTEWNI